MRRHLKGVETGTSPDKQALTGGASQGVRKGRPPESIPGTPAPPLLFRFSFRLGRAQIHPSQRHSYGLSSGRRGSATQAHVPP